MQAKNRDLPVYGYDFHGNWDPWDFAPHWAIELRCMMGRVLEILEDELSRSQPASIDLALPEIYRNGVLMASLELSNAVVETITILTRDAAGDVVPAPAGDVFTVVSSNPASLNAVIGADSKGAPAVVINALVQASPGLSFTVSDSAGLAVFTEDVDIVSDLTPKALGLDLANIESASQPIPSNPGP